MTTPLDPMPAIDYSKMPDPMAPPEWLLLVVRSVEDGRYLLMRRPGATAWTLLSTAPPHRSEGFEQGLSSLVRTHMSVRVRGEPRLSREPRPVRMRHPYTGGDGTGYVRAVAVDVAGEPKADALYQGVVALPLEEAVEALATDLERTILRDGAALLGDR